MEEAMGAKGAAAVTEVEAASAVALKVAVELDSEEVAGSGPAKVAAAV